MQPRRVYKHYINPEVFNHPINFNVIGIGATGAEFCRRLAQICQILKTMNIDTSVTLWDGDRVEENNIGKQIFSIHDIGVNKAEVMAYRINSFYGFKWSHTPEFWNPSLLMDKGAFYSTCQIICGAVDSWETRVKLNKYFRNKIGYYLDMGNDRFTGQAILGVGTDIIPKGPKDNVTILPSVTEIFKDHVSKKTDEEPSCSVLESIHRQDLMINPMIANLGANIIWNLLFRKVILTHGYFLNINDTMLTELNVKPWKLDGKSEKKSIKK